MTSAGMTDADRDTLIAKVKRRGGRGDRSPLGTWFWDIDRMLLLLTLFLIAIGLIAVAAAATPLHLRDNPGPLCPHVAGPSTHIGHANCSTAARNAAPRAS